MAELLKHVYNELFIKNLGEAFARQAPYFDLKKFESSVFSRNWQDLELKARMRRITECLQHCMTDDYGENLRVLLDVSEVLKTHSKPGFEYMLFPDFVELYGQDDFDLSINALEQLTKLASAEFAVRPFIMSQPKKMMAKMSAWAKSPDADVRRLASEGCRPRLPWAMALPNFKNDPKPILPVLRQLKNDKSLYVRRSVANNLNDISKDHPDVVLDIAQQWLGENDETDWIVKHALRGLLKSADATALGLFGYGDVKHLELCELRLEKTVSFGDYLPFSFELKTSAKSIGNLRIEYAIDFMKSNGKTARKIFKVSESNYRQTNKEFQRKHAFKPIATRQHYPGEHGFALLLNGVEVASHRFLLTGL